MRASWTGVAVALMASGCEGGSTPPDAVTDLRQTVVDMPAIANRDLDLLFVIDDSEGMIERQTTLALNFSTLLDRLGKVPGGTPNLHIGVVTTDMGTKASGSATPAPPIGQMGQGGCSGTGKGGALQIHNAQITDRFLIDVDQPGGGRMRNYTGSLELAFSAMISAGAGGCGFEQPLAAMRAALDNHPANAGFLRPEALLGVIFLADEDDCSAKSTALFDPNAAATLGSLQSFRCTRFGVTCAIGGATPDAMNQAGIKSECRASPSSPIIEEIPQFRDFLVGLKGDARRIITAGLIGPPEPVEVKIGPPPGGGTPVPLLSHSCSLDGSQGLQIANPGVRLKGFLDSFADQSAHAEVCQPSYSNSLLTIGEMFRKAIGNPCLDKLLADADPNTPGEQLDCIVEDLVAGTAREIPSCDASPGTRPCWIVVSAGGFCDLFGQSGLILSVMRDMLPPPGTRTRMRCLVAR
jgi:hypothetical protein